MNEFRLLSAVDDAEQQRAEMKEKPKKHPYPPSVMAWYGELLRDMRRSMRAERRG